jgi:hypothetical protein
MAYHQCFSGNANLHGGNVGHRLITALLVITSALPLLAQNAVRPTPRHADGRVNFGPPPGEVGIWLPGAGLGIRNQLAVESGTNQFPDLKPTLSQVPFQPWARELYEYRRNGFEPHTRCKPSGGARQFLTPYGVELVDMPDLKRFFIMDVGGPHSFRTVFMDGRPHPKDLEPSYYGHSIGRWEGDTLVVDSVGFNEKFFFDRYGSPHTERLHLIERFSRTDLNTLKYEITVDDPGAYTATWKSGFFLRWTPGTELFEYVCQENNRDTDIMLGVDGAVDPNHSEIVP